MKRGKRQDVTPVSARDAVYLAAQGRQLAPMSDVYKAAQQGDLLGMGVSAAGVMMPYGAGAIRMGRGVGAAESTTARQTLFHYTNEAGASGISGSNSLNPSLWRVGTKDVRYGNGQYLSDIAPGTMTPAQLSRAFLGRPFHGNRFTHYVEIDATGLGAVQGRAGVYVVPNEVPLDLTGRILNYGKVPGR